MLIQEVVRMEPVERLLYWVAERHSIYLKRQQGLPRPWTDDVILQSYFFTNVYRELDKTTVWFRQNIRDPLKDDAKVLLATAAFRWFNLISTGMELLKPEGSKRPAEYVEGLTDPDEWNLLVKDSLLCRWESAVAIKRLRKLAANGKQVFTGAYMIKVGNGPPGCKVANVCDAITRLHNDRFALSKLLRTATKLRDVWQVLKTYPYLGPFMSYEIVTDLRHTAFLRDAQDVDTWANAGPGAKRGLHRLAGKEIKWRTDKISRYSIRTMRELLGVFRTRLPHMPHFELREVEHSLCEWSKYENALDIHLRGISTGIKLKRRYNGS